MKRTNILIRIDGPKRAYQPGESLAGNYAIEATSSDAIQAAELSILWHTEGKGDEDLAVHQFERVSMETEPDWNPHEPRRFHSVLPNSPLSYDGVIVKIRWRIRVRVFLAGGRELVEEQRVQLGDVASPVPVT